MNFGNNNNLVTNLNQNVGNNFNLMFPPGRKRRRRSASTPDPQTFLQKKRKTEKLEGIREEKEMREALRKVGNRGAICEMVELEAAWNLLKISLQMEQAS